MRRSSALLVAGCATHLLAGACITNRVGVGVLRPHMEVERFANERSDRDPTADVNGQAQATMWMPEQTAPAPGSRDEKVQRALATIAAIAAGAMPALVWSGTFDENRLFQKPPQPEAPTPPPRN